MASSIKRLIFFFFWIYKKKRKKKTKCDGNISLKLCLLYYKLAMKLAYSDFKYVRHISIECGEEKIN